MAKTRHKEIPAPASSQASNPVDLTVICNGQTQEMYAPPGHTPENVNIVSLAPGLDEVTFARGDVEGRQWICRPRRDLGVLISALIRTPALNYSMSGDAILLAQLKLSGHAIHGEQNEDSTASAAITYFPPGSHLPVRLPRVGPWYTIALVGTIDAIEEKWGLGLAMARALDHTPESLRECTEIVRKPWMITQAATELLRDILSFRFDGVVARAHVEARSQQMLCEALAGMSSSYRQRPLPARTRQLVQRARVIIANNPEQPHTLQSLSRSLGLNRTLLAEGFHAEFGETVFAFLQHERLRRAWTLLENARERVASVATRVGYRDAASFTRAFKAHYGVTPRHVSRAPGDRRPTKKSSTTH